MGQCEMCAANADNLEKVLIEGVEMKVCSKCVRFGTRVAKPKPKAQVAARAAKVFSKPRVTRSIDDNRFVPANAGQVVKAARERLGMRQIDLSRKISVSESEIHQFENGSFTPTLSVAEKFEKGLGIKIIEKAALSDDEDDDTSSSSPTHGFTLGDMIKVKKK